MRRPPLDVQRLQPLRGSRLLGHLARRLLTACSMSNTKPEMHLSEQHAALERLFGKLLEAVHANATDDIASLWTQFDTRLRGHFQLEETELLPSLRAVDTAEADALLAEHEDLRRSLDEFAVRVDLHLTRADRVDAFVAKLRAHAEREDELFYPWAQKHIQAANPELGARAMGLLHDLGGRIL